MTAAVHAVAPHGPVVRTRPHSTRVLAGALVAAGAASLTFQALAGRRLGPDAYGALAVLLVCHVVATVPLVALQAGVTAQVARAASGGSGLDRVGLAADTTRLAAVAAVVVAAASVPIGLVLRLPQPVAGIGLGSTVAAAVVAAVLRGVLLGCDEPRRVASSWLTGAAVRVAAAAVLLAVHPSFTAAVTAFVAAEVAMAWRLWLDGRTAPTGPSRIELRAATPWRAQAGVVGLCAFMAIDVAAVRHLFDAATSGVYLAAATCARTIFHLSRAAAMALVRPQAVAGHSDARRRLVGVVGGVGGAGSLGCAALWLAGPAVVAAAFGEAYRPSGLLLALCGIAATGFGLVDVAQHAGMARGRSRWLPIWAGGAVLVAAVVVAGSPASVAFAAAVVAAGTGAACTAAALRSVTERPGRDRRRALDPTPPGAPELSVVVPFHDPGPQLRPHLERLLRVLDDDGVGYEVVAVSDGCTDGSETTITDLGDRLSCIVLAENGGKGYALRQGMAASRGRYVGFIDGDGDLDPELLRPFLAVMRHYEVDFVVGSKHHPLSQVEVAPTRRIVSWTYRALVRILFRFGAETQTGIKIVRRDVLADVLPLLREDGFAFDLELLVAADRRGFRRVFECPVRICRTGTTTVTAGRALATLRATVVVAGRRWLTGAYDRREDAS